jgi:hypothetical protein
LDGKLKLIRGNLYYHVGNGVTETEAFSRDGGATKLTFAAWVALGYDTHSRYGNPLFYNAVGGDFRTMIGSPARGGADVAVFAGATPIYDYSGKVLIWNGSELVTIPDMGAYQSQPQMGMGMGM